MEKPNNDNAILYATYTTLYVNDIACNAIKDIKTSVNRKDKKILKRWRELNSETQYYFNHFRRTVKMDGLYFVSNFNEVIDDCAEKPITQLETAIKYCLKRFGVENIDLTYKTILAHVLTEFAVSTVESLCEKLKEENIPFLRLKGWCIKKIQKNMREFYFRALRGIDNNVIDEIKGIIEPIITLLTSQIAKYENFERAYEYAVKENSKQ